MGDLSKDFSQHEFACRDGCGFDTPDPRLVDALQELRDLIGVPIHINSACRCSTWNTNAGGKPNSQHLIGKAADISTDDADMSLLDLLLAIHEIDAFYNGGIGIYPTHIHVDVRGHIARWTEESKGHEPVY